jgi:hypothetical protein
VSTVIALTVVEKNYKRTQDIYDSLIEYYKEAFGENKYGIVGGIVSALRRLTTG